MFGSITGMALGLTGTRMGRAIPVIGLISLSLSSSCMAEKPELRVAIGMPVGELLEQPAATNLGVDMREDRPDFWGTERPLRLRVLLPGGELLFDYERQIGVYITSSLRSEHNAGSRMSRISTIGAPALFSSISSESEFIKVGELCEEIRKKMDEYYYERKNFDSVNDTIKFNENYKQIELCEYGNDQFYISVDLVKSSDGEFFPKIFLSRQ